MELAFRESLKKMRGTKSKEKFSQELEMSRSNYSRIESGKSDPTIKTLEQIAKLTNSTLVVDLIPNEPTEPESEQVTLDLEMEEEKSDINHVIGRNGSGKSQLAKDFILNRGGYFSKNIPNQTLVISSYSNLPKELTLNDVIKTVSWSLSAEIYRLLGLENVPNNIPLKKLSDGQNQKIKFRFSFQRSCSLAWPLFHAPVHAG